MSTNSEQILKNKKLVMKMMKNIAESSPADINKCLLNAYHSDVEWRGFYPLEDLKGLEALEIKVWRPLLQAFPDLERRNNIVIGGEFNNKYFVGTVGHLTGTFKNSWLDVPATNKTVHLRTCEFHQIENEKIIQTHMLIDVMDFIRQAGFWPINKSLGVEEMWPGPITGDGIVLEEQDPTLSKKTLEQALAMQKTLGDYKPETTANISDEQLRKELLNHPQKEYWHSKMMWYGPCGIGTARGLSGFVDHHQMPFRKTFRDRDYWTIGHYVEIGDGKYSATSGWHCIVSKHRSKEWLGYNPTGNSITMKVMDFYLHDEGLIRENWVPIDILHILKQIDVDVIKMINEKI